MVSSGRGKGERGQIGLVFYPNIFCIIRCCNQVNELLIVLCVCAKSFTFFGILLLLQTSAFKHYIKLYNGN